MSQHAKCPKGKTRRDQLHVLTAPSHSSWRRWLHAMSECANPLLLGWIKEWLDQARERNSKGFTV